MGSDRLSVVGVTSLRGKYSRHSCQHRFVEPFYVFGADGSPNLDCNFFDCILWRRRSPFFSEVLLLGPQILDLIHVMAVSSGLA